MLTRRGVLAGVGAALVGCRTDPVSSSSSASSAPAVTAASTSRNVIHVLDAQRTRDGAGVALRRALGGRALPMLDPFLLLDEFHSDNPDDYAEDLENWAGFRHLAFGLPKGRETLAE